VHTYRQDGDGFFDALAKDQGERVWFMDTFVDRMNLRNMVSEALVAFGEGLAYQGHNNLVGNSSP
jgi:hypothetical protein